jgi:hypothetical protein
MKGAKTRGAEPEVLIGILKDRRDLALLLKKRCYRIPVSHTPRRRFDYLGFYQTAAFGKSGQCIRYLAPVLGRSRARRMEIIPGEPRHPRAGDYYWLYRVGRPMLLPKPVRNIGPRRFTFAYTTLRHLFESHDILEVFGVPPIERIMQEEFAKAGIPALSEFTLSAGRKRYRLDFAVFCANGGLAIECDGEEFHHHPVQARYDRAKDTKLRKLGWTVLRLTEAEIVASPARCLMRVKNGVHRLGGSLS